MKFLTKLILILLLIAVILFLARGFFNTETPSKTEDKHAMLLEQIDEMGQLEVVKYKIKDIVEYTKDKGIRLGFNMNLPMPDLRATLIIYAEVIGCVNLSAINEENVYIEGDSVRLTLPEPQICHVVIDHNKSETYDTKNQWFYNDTKLIDEAYRAAENQIRREFSRDVLVEGRESATKIMKAFLKVMGFRAVTIEFEQPILKMIQKNNNLFEYYNLNSITEP